MCSSLIAIFPHTTLDNYKKNYKIGYVNFKRIALIANI